MNKRGQALVEFIIIAPLFIMLILCLVDFGKIFYAKNELESAMNEIILLHNAEKSDDDLYSYLKKNVNDSILLISYDDNNITYKITKNVSLSTPGLNVILKNPYEASVKRVISYE